MTIKFLLNNEVKINREKILVLENIKIFTFYYENLNYKIKKYKEIIN